MARGDPPGPTIPYVIHFTRNWSLFTAGTLPPSVFIICIGAFEASWGLPTDTRVMGGAEAWFWYLQRLHLDGTAPAAGGPLTGYTTFWFTNDPDWLQM